MLLNLGCGQRFHAAWTNLDVAPASAEVRRWDVRKGIPYADGAADAIYHSHVLEHMERQEAPVFLRECHRVLRRRGVLRVVVPDLEQIARTYLLALEKALASEPGWEHNYDWMMIELYDQTVRERSGGAMLDYFRQQPLPNEPFVQERLGGEARNLRRALAPPAADARPAFQKAMARMRSLGGRTRSALARRAMGNENYRALQLGRFRLQGEIHKWMYDRYSLGQLLLRAGFQEPKVMSPTESLIPGWQKYFLDNEPDGSVYKPDSLFMESVKP